MSQVTVYVSPQQSLPFPGLCAHCLQPAMAQMPVRRRQQWVTRLVDVPLCIHCVGELQRRSLAEERWEKIGWLAGGLLLVLTLVAMLLLTPAAWGFGWRLLAGLIAAGVMGTAAMSLFRRLSRRAAPPQKKAIENAVRMTSFWGNRTTFTFSNETFAEQFRALGKREVGSTHPQG